MDDKDEIPAENSTKPTEVAEVVEGEVVTEHKA
jgi:hypothetical protein